MQGCEEVLRAVEDHLESLCSELTRHVAVPHAYHYQDILDTHLLQQVKKFRTCTLLSPVIGSLDQRLCVTYESPLRRRRLSVYSVGYYLAARLADPLP